MVAEEIRHSWDEPPAQATVVEIGILIGEPENSPPYFETDKLVPKHFICCNNVIQSIEIIVQYILYFFIFSL